MPIDSAIQEQAVLDEFFIPRTPDLHVDTINGKTEGDGLSWTTAFKTMTPALAAVQTGGKIWFIGDVRTQDTGSHLVYDVTIEGVGSLHHPDRLGTEHSGASMWRMPASAGSETTPLLIVRGRGWKFKNIFFDGPATAAAVQLVRTAEGASEYDASHATFDGCRFTTGRNHIENNGGVSNITIKNSEFRGATAGSIVTVSGAGIAYPLNWKIVGNHFMADNGSASGNASHIIMPMMNCVIKDNTFGLVTSTAKYVDLAGGVGGNMICGNYFAGVYNTDDYVSAAATDMWLGNFATIVTTTCPAGFTVLIPAAP